jgi:hypothetical protein
MNATRLIATLFLTPLLAAAGSPEAHQGIPSRSVILHDLFGASSSGLSLQEGSTLQSRDEQKKSVALASIYSLLLPGMGELYAGEFESGKYFLAGEAALWLTYAVFNVYGNSLRDDSRAYATAYAGVNPAGKDDQYYVNIGNFLSITDYNQKKLRDRSLDAVYAPNSGYDWQWESDAARTFYRSQRISSENVYNNRKYVVAAVIVNHVLSAINAGRAAVRYNSSLDNALGDLQIRAGVIGGIASPQGLELSLVKPF